MRRPVSLVPFRACLPSSSNAPHAGAVNCRTRRRPSSACRHLLPVKTGRRDLATTPAIPSPRPLRGEGKGEGQR
ncbi:hypothetical protein FJ548_13455 [Mesorhizobium sp. B2-4-17]|nr:hypothetical protein FJ548_13455 [Mesorhizobium sp. B2-4-17]